MRERQVFDKSLTDTGESRMDTSNRNLLQRAHHELKEGLRIALYLWVVFGLLLLHKSMILAEHNIDFAYHGFALINALALAKVMLVARHIPLGERLKNAPLIYPTVLKSALFTAVLACFKTAEDAVIGWYRHETFRQSITDLGGGTWRGVLSLAMLVFAMLVPFVGYGELGRVLGEGKLERIFFEPGTP
jgi:hypothetical protein